MADLLSLSECLESSSFDVKFITFHRPGRESQRDTIFITDPHRSVFKLFINALQSVYWFIKTRPDVVVSSGAGVVIPYMILARICNVKSFHFELACQISKPSRTGLAMKRLGVACFGQSRKLTPLGFEFVANPFSRFRVEPLIKRRVLKKIFIALGNAPERFSRINKVIGHLIELFPSAQIVFQFGHTSPHADFKIDSYRFLSREIFIKELNSADLIIVHGGVGVILEALSCGRPPIIVPRYSKLGEHTDVTQPDLARFVASTGLGCVIGEKFVPADIEEAVEYCVGSYIVSKQDPTFAEEFASIIKESVFA